MDFKSLEQTLDKKHIQKPSSGNQRAYADLIEEAACAEAKVKFRDAFRPSSSVRSPEDFMLISDKKLLVDVKTRQLNTAFNMPNLISVDRLDKILSDDKQELYYWFLDYEVLPDGSCDIAHSHIRPVWSLPWDALEIQNLGKGQLQIKDWSKINPELTDKTSWHQELGQRRKAFYLKQAEKFKKMAEKIRLT